MSAAVPKVSTMEKVVAMKVMSRSFSHGHRTKFDILSVLEVKFLFFVPNPIITKFKRQKYNFLV